MIPFAGLIAMALVSLVAYHWAMSATNRFVRLAIERGLIQRDLKDHYKADSVTGFLILSGGSFGRLRALFRTSADQEIEVARKVALFRWVLAPVVVLSAGVATWVGLFAVTQ